MYIGLVIYMKSVQWFHTSNKEFLRLTWNNYQKFSWYSLSFQYSFTKFLVPPQTEHILHSVIEKWEYPNAKDEGPTVCSLDHVFFKNYFMLYSYWTARQKPENINQKTKTHLKQTNKQKPPTRKTTFQLLKCEWENKPLNITEKYTMTS